MMKDALRQQLSAAVFGASLVAMIVATRLLWPEETPLARYDALFLGAVGVQIWLYATGRETLEELQATALFHIVGTVMEVFKTQIGAWAYPEPCLLQIAGVPLFSGFMYSAVGSYIARAWRLMDLRFQRFPPLWAAMALAAAIYANFFSHHFIWDWRALLFALSLLLFGRCWARGRIGARAVRFPVVGFFVLVGLLTWGAENLATWANIWLYPNQMSGWRPVSITKFGSWYLLMIVSFVLVAAIHRPDRAAPAPAE